MLKQLKIPVSILISFAALSFLHCDFAVCALYCLIFISEVRSKKYIDFATVFFISVFFDAYTSRFTGISAIPLTIFFIASNQLRPVLANAQAIIQIYCFSALLCICKFFHSVIIFLLTMNLNLIDHIFQILLATSILSVFYIGEIIFLKAKNWHVG
jgi:hypothetical protein